MKTEEKINKGGYFKETYAFWSAENIQYGGYSTEPGKNIAGTDCDVAHVRWKGNWTMPTMEQFKELRDDCTWTKETRKGVVRYKVTGPNGKSIFLPCQGRYSGNSLLSKNVEGNYWSSTVYLFSPEYQYGYAMIFNESDGYNLSHNTRKNGLNIRPVISGKR